MLGELTWLLSQSKIHRTLKLADLEWLLMPPILLGQVRIFKRGDQPVGFALWAFMDADTAETMGRTGRVDAADWRKGTDVLQLAADQRAGRALAANPPEGDCWIVDFAVPFATPDNSLAQACLADLLNGPLKGRRVKMHKTDLNTGEKTVVELGS